MLRLKCTLALVLQLQSAGTSTTIKHLDHAFETALTWYRVRLDYPQFIAIQMWHCWTSYECVKQWLYYNIISVVLARNNTQPCHHAELFRGETTGKNILYVQQKQLDWLSVLRNISTTSFASCGVVLFMSFISLWRKQILCLPPRLYYPCLSFVSEPPERLVLVRKSSQNFGKCPTVTEVR